MKTDKPILGTPTQSNFLAAVSWRNLAYILMLLGAAALAVTGLGTLVFGKASMSGWVLMLHASAAPAFAVGLALVALTWAGHSCAGAEDLLSHRAASLLFWVILASGLVVILSGVAPMTPLCGTNGQRTLVSVHYYGALLLTAAVALHVFSLVAVKRRGIGV
ncbi:MAG: hypothetical protein A2107_06910 [Verrucomicrobia bacterium GWF2_62_7]|nr:MAG: hypothetical protein A2107_06910 [Verrucomicrobia bacterium GWF2_62_7]